ncbi:bas1, putative [Talaromyces stipitatus ATCC 10500]|uniref:Bas1, putative n=1 Tax=Talaromyces stipitatus (strain ATCC 10500 / CBS 375.48 / QM 6759 / NRRL 1006) TaxID=441959 RepID=B8MSQ1_TALSN|nr:bas1, putative [Talaromyces stipitatus ATCC 10500]EED12509.1 bas1, putative [Talaromyces stipitatus ATCC 10500]
MNRSRNLWSQEEDNTLRRLVEACEKDKVDWRLIASYLPGRNNKDCRKRWHYRVAATMNLGPWSQTEDELLKMGIHRHGTHWSRVAQVVGTRNGDQCFKRWNDVLDPAIDRSPWTRDEDRRLLLAIGEFGRAWKQIVDTYFPGRTGLDAKNRHRQLTRKRKREHRPSTKTKTIKQEPQQQQQVFTPAVQSPLPRLTPASSSPSLSAVGTPSIIIPSQQHIDPSPQNQQVHLHLHDQVLGRDDTGTERSLSTPPGLSSSYCWDMPVEGLFSPSLSIPTPTPATPYSSCSSLSTGTYEPSLSHFDGEQQYENRELSMHGLPVHYPYYIPAHERALSVQQHLDFLPSHAHTSSHPGMVVSSPFHAQGVLPAHHQPYTALDGIVM